MPNRRSKQEQKMLAYYALQGGGRQYVNREQIQDDEPKVNDKVNVGLKGKG